MQGYLPVAYGYGFVELEKAGQRHGWISLQLLGWSLHDVVSHNRGLKTWAKFYEVITLILTILSSKHTACEPEIWGPAGGVKLWGKRRGRGGVFRAE